MEVRCELHESDSVNIRITTIMSLGGWQKICGALESDHSYVPRQLLREIRSAIQTFEHNVVVRRAEEEGSAG